jgi:hypothetical protein
METPIYIKSQIIQQGRQQAERGLNRYLLTGYPKATNYGNEINLGGTYTPDNPDALSQQTGMPIYGRVILGEGLEGDLNTYTDYQGNQQIYNTIYLDQAIVTADYNQQVIITNIQGRNGSIKEYISSGDLNVNITGLFTSGRADESPINFIDSMARIMQASVSIPITNKYLNLLGVERIVIMPGSSMPQTIGGYSQQQYTIVAISDIPTNEILP